MNLFIASELHWPEAGVTLRQETSFPDEGRARLVFTCEKPVELRLNLRHPYWATRVSRSKSTARSSPREHAGKLRGGGADVAERRHGGNHDAFQPRTEGFRDNPRRVALMYGPLVLCAETSAGSTKLPIRLSSPGGPLTAGLEPIPGQDLCLHGHRKFCAWAERPSRVTLETDLPHARESPYVVYWNALARRMAGQRGSSPCRSSAHRGSRPPGREQNERRTPGAGRRTGTGAEGWRHAVDGGWFSWDLQGSFPASRRNCTSNTGEATPAGGSSTSWWTAKSGHAKLDNNRPGDFYEETYPLPERLTQGKRRSPSGSRRIPEDGGRRFRLRPAFQPGTLSFFTKAVRSPRLVKAKN